MSFNQFETLSIRQILFAQLIRLEHRLFGVKKRCPNGKNLLVIALTALDARNRDHLVDCFGVIFDQSERCLAELETFVRKLFRDTHSVRWQTVVKLVVVVNDERDVDAGNILSLVHLDIVDQS